MLQKETKQEPIGTTASPASYAGAPHGAASTTASVAAPKQEHRRSRRARTYERGNDYSAVSPAVIKRLPRYYRYLRELLRRDILRISSSELSEMMNVTASQIRQDLNCFGGFGQQGYGYNVKYLYGKISDILGVSSDFSAVIIGAGNLGHAIAGSSMFEHRNVDIVGIFDVSSSVIGKTIAGLTVMDMAELPAFAERVPIDIAILTVPKENAHPIAQDLARVGIRGVWNFSSTELDLKSHGILVENVHMGDSLMRLMYEINNTERLNNV